MSMSLRCLALYIQPPAAPAASSRGPQIMWILALLLCVLGSIDPMLLSLIAYR
jgi:hypothetical protein